MPITAIYASLLVLLYVTLSAKVIGLRFHHRISVGDGDNKALRQAIRCHANCAEYAPLGILMLGLVELQQAPELAVHALGVMLVLGRVLHMIGFGRYPQIMLLRRSGMILTFSALVLAALGLLGHSLM